MKPLNAKTHVYRHLIDFPVERKLLQHYVVPGDRLLDVGTGATGRSALLAKSFGAAVTSVEINAGAIQEFGATPERADMGLAAADLVALPFQDSSFSVVLVALHGLDYVLDQRDRLQSFGEIHRVLAPGGVLIFNGFNPIGMLLSPTGLRSPGGLKARARYALSGRFLRSTLIDVNGLELHQATPQAIIRSVESAGGFTLGRLTNLSGSTESKLKITAFGTAPYYAFRKA